VLVAACAALALALGLGTALAVAAQDPGADSPEAAVEQLLQGIADLDAAAIVRVVDPAEVADASRADDAYARLEDRVLRVGDVPPVEVDRVLVAAEDQLGGAFSRQALAVLAAVDLELDGLDLDVEPLGPGTAQVRLRGGLLGVTVDRDRLPGEAVIDAGGGSGAASYDMELAEGWQRDGEPFEAYLVATEVDGRWYVSLEATADDLLAGP
jgi:hypothetical protein